MRVLTTIFALLITLSLTAKENTFNGYIVNRAGVRIDGQIKVKNVTTDQMKITFIDSDGIKLVYKPVDLISYAYEFKGENEFGEDTFVWRHYKSKTAQSYAPRFYASKEVFMEVMEQGAITLYDYYVEVPQNIEEPYIRLFYMEMLGSDELIEVSKENYIEIVSKQFEDNYELADKVGKVNHRFRHLWKIVRLYNDWKEMQDIAPAADIMEEQKEYSEEIPF